MVKLSLIFKIQPVLMKQNVKLLHLTPYTIIWSTESCEKSGRRYLLDCFTILTRGKPIRNYPPSIPLYDGQFDVVFWSSLSNFQSLGSPRPLPPVDLVCKIFFKGSTSLNLLIIPLTMVESLYSLSLYTLSRGLYDAERAILYNQHPKEPHTMMISCHNCLQTSESKKVFFLGWM